MNESEASGAFAERLLAWFDVHGRHDLPWQHPRSAYRVWLSEVMLQQTQVVTVIGYFERFVQRFPDVPSLAAAQLDEVLALWSGLGYYSRARNLHAAARLMVQRHGGDVPDSADALLQLPGIGRSTAAAILSQAFGQRAAILDGNVRRVLARRSGEVQWPGLPQVQTRLWALAESLLPTARMADYTQALMDLGASVCSARRPSCISCPVRSGCVAEATARVAQIPESRPRREMPLRHLHWLLLHNAQQQVMLERRPPSGIWGGLFALPESDQLDELAKCHGLRPAQLQPLTRVDHVFTHFRLQAQVWTANADQAQAGLEEPAQRRWASVSDALQLGLPTPLRRLLAARGAAQSTTQSKRSA